MEEKIDRRKEKNKEWNKVIKRSEKEIKEKEKDSQTRLDLKNSQTHLDLSLKHRNLDIEEGSLGRRRPGKKIFGFRKDQIEAGTRKIQKNENELGGGGDIGVFRTIKSRELAQFTTTDADKNLCMWYKIIYNFSSLPSKLESECSRTRLEISTNQEVVFVQTKDDLTNQEPVVELFLMKKDFCVPHK